MHDRQKVCSSVSTATLLVAASLLLHSGCSDPAGRSTVIPDSTLALVLSDLYLADAEFQLGALADSLESDSPGVPVTAGSARDSILASHGLDENTFMDAMEIYINDPDRYVSLFDQVLDRLNMSRQATSDQ